MEINIYDVFSRNGNRFQTFFGLFVFDFVFMKNKMRMERFLHENRSEQ